MALIEVENVVKTYGGRRALDGVSLTIQHNEIVAILGPNGAGKTTLVETIAGLRRPDSGRVRVMGHNAMEDARAIKTVLGVQLQESLLPDRIEVREALELFASFYPEPADAGELLIRLGLEELANRRFGQLSGGQKQRVSIALALIGRPRIAILDELTTGLDPQARRDTWELIEALRADGLTIVLVTHFMEEAERLADRVALIDDGRLMALGTPVDLIANAGVHQRLSFRPSAPVDLAALAGLPQVLSVGRRGPFVDVEGTGQVVAHVVGYLAALGVVTEALQVDRASLDDAFLQLTGRRLVAAHTEE